MLPTWCQSEYLVAVATKSSICPSSSSLSPRWPEVPGTLSLGPLWPLQEAAPPHPDRLCAATAQSSAWSSARVQGRTGQRGLLGDMQTMGARGPGSPRPPAHSGAGPEGPGQTYRAPKLARNSSSARQLPACSPAAHGAQLAPLPSLGPLPLCLCPRLQQLVLTVQRPQGRSDGGSQRGGDPPFPASPTPAPSQDAAPRGTGTGGARLARRSRSQPSPRRRPGLGAVARGLPVIQLNGNHIPSKQGREEGDVEIVQLVDRHLHGGLIHFGIHGSGCRGALAGLRAGLGWAGWAAAGCWRAGRGWALRVGPWG